MAYEQRQELEQLMGKDLLINLPSDYDPRYTATQSDLHNPSVLDDPKICKSFVVGICPHTLIPSKRDFERCPKIHSERYRLLYDACLKSGVPLPNFELDYMDDLESYVEDCNVKIKRALKRLEHTPEEKAQLSNLTRQLDELDIKIGLGVQEVELLVGNACISQSAVESEKVAQLVTQREALSRTYNDLLENLGQASQQKLQVCEVCGAYLSRLDNDRRLADHFIGKMHLGYDTMRSELSRLTKKYGSRSRGYRRRH